MFVFAAVVCYLRRAARVKYGYATNEDHNVGESLGECVVPGFLRRAWAGVIHTQTDIQAFGIIVTLAIMYLVTSLAISITTLVGIGYPITLWNIITVWLTGEVVLFLSLMVGMSCWACIKAFISAPDIDYTDL